MVVVGIINNDFYRTFSLESMANVVVHSKRIIYVVATELSECCKVIKKLIKYKPLQCFVGIIKKNLIKMSYNPHNIYILHFAKM